MIRNMRGMIPAAGEIESTQAGRTNSLDGKPDSGGVRGYQTRGR